MTAEPAGLDLEFIEEGRLVRSREAARRRRLAIGVSVAVTAVWLVYVTVAGHWERVVDNWAASVTMVFGSFVAGSTPQGGGAVAFPVFTKALEVPAEVARTFSLSIQTIGMGAATAAILINRRRVEWRAVAVGLPVAAIGFLFAITLLSDGGDPFRAPIVPGPYIKVTFTLVVAAMALITYLGSRVRIREVSVELPGMNTRTTAALVVMAALGGIAAAFTGSGADVLIYLYVAVLLAVDPKVGVPTSVIVMTGISVIGFATLGILDGQLSVAVAGDTVTSVGGTAVALDAARYDLFGLWIAAAPVVAWGAPLGSWVASKVKTRQLVVFVAILAAAEILTTILFLDELRSDAALVAYGIAGAVVLGAGLWWIASNRRRFFALEGVDLDRAYSRKDLDVAPGYRQELDPSNDSGG